MGAQREDGNRPVGQPPQSQSDKTKKPAFGGRQWIATILTLVVIVFVFAVVFPSLGDYSEAWTAVQGMSAGWIIALIVVTIGVVAIYPWPFQEALPGLKYRPAFVIRQTAFMIGNVIPEGGAIGLGGNHLPVTLISWPILDGSARKTGRGSVGCVIASPRVDDRLLVGLVGRCVPTFVPERYGRSAPAIRS